MASALDRILAQAGITDLVAILAERLEPTDLQTLMLEVYRKRSGARSAADVLGDYERGRFFGAATLGAAALERWRAVTAPLLQGRFEPLILSPMTPLGTCAAVAGVAQDWSVPTARTGEVVSDPTNVLALELALRRRAALRRDPKDAGSIHFTATHRVVRPQAFSNPNMLAHFSMFALASAGRDSGAFGFEREAAATHVGFYLRAFRDFLGASAAMTLTYTIKGRGADDARVRMVLDLARALDVATAEEPDRAAVDTYYSGFCFHVWAHIGAQAPLQLADGGTVDWSAKLLSSAKERMFISGCGLDRLCALL
jgi:hypothetical protein